MDKENRTVPPDNLITQGFGERFLAVETNVDKPRNRRMTARGHDLMDGLKRRRETTAAQIQLTR